MNHNTSFTLDTKSIIPTSKSEASLPVVERTEAFDYHSCDQIQNPKPESAVNPTRSHVHFSSDDHSIPSNSGRKNTTVKFPDKKSYENDEDMDQIDLELDEENEKTLTKKYTKRQWLVLVVFGFAEFFSAVCVSLQAPFYPAEAEKKGVTATEYGLVFGVFELTVFLVSFVYGRYMDVVGPKLIFNLGILTTGTCAILFGFLDRIEDRTTFFALSMVTRIIEATGDGAFITASFTIIAMEFPKAVATTFAAMETFFGLGLICGPLIGSLLFTLGGYTLPFVVNGCLLFLSAILTFFILPSHPNKKTGPRETNSGKGLIDLLKIPSVSICTLIIFSSAVSIGFLSATLEPHIRQFNLSPITVGLMFIISGGTYAFVAPLWGWICDISRKLDLFSLIGAVLIILGFQLIGPAPYLPFDTTLWVTIVGLALHGFGLGATLVSSFIQALREALSHGFKDNVATYGLISGLWTSSFALGNFIGPTCSGVLFDMVGFRSGTLVIIGLQIIIVILILISMFNRRRNENSIIHEENTPLLGKGRRHSYIG